MWHTGNWGEGFCNGTFLGFGPGLIGWIFPLVFLSLIIFGVFLIVRRLISGKLFYKNNAIDILKTRYASGEINQQEFSEIKSDLSSR